MIDIIMIKRSIAIVFLILLSTGAFAVTGDITVEGRLDATGNISAASLYGNGTNITSLDAGQITLGVIPVGRGGTGQSAALVAGGILYSTSTSTMAVTTAGATYEYLQSAGTGTPIWAQPGPASIQVFTTPGANTWNKPAGLLAALVITTGGGGGGGAADSSDGSSGQGGGGGGAGGTCIELFAASALGASETVTIGDGGAGGTDPGGTGTTGTASTFGAYHTANGGAGGVGRSQAAVSNAAAGGAGGTASNGNVNIVGGAGDTGFAATATAAYGGQGGASYWGGGAVGPILIVGGATAGTAGTTYGSGGSGAVDINTAAGVAGGKGAPGVCIVIEYK